MRINDKTSYYNDANDLELEGNWGEIITRDTDTCTLKGRNVE